MSKTTIASIMFSVNENIMNFSCMKFRQDEHGRIEAVYPGANVINRNERTDEYQNSKDLCDYVEQQLNIVSLLKNDGEEQHEKFALMIVNDDSDFSVDISTLSDEFYGRNITLAIVACETLHFGIWDLYRRSARNTGGDYMLLSNAPRVLSRVISSVINEQNTIRQVFLQIDTENAQPVATGVGHVEAEGGTINNLSDFDFDHGLSF
ncbi:unnamed protein product [Rotaria sp. Silwood1]